MENIRFYSKLLRFRKEEDGYYTLTPYAKLIRVNATGYRMMLMCEDIHSFEELVEKVMEEYGLEQDRAVAETEKFVRLMLKCGLLCKIE